MIDLLLKNGHCILPDTEEDVDIAIKGEKIVKIANSINEEAHIVKDLAGLTVLPGVIDSQVHFREPGLTHKEDLKSGSMSAVAGGVTTFLEMPNTSPSTTNIEALNEKVKIAKKNSYANFGFFMGANGNNLDVLKQISSIEGCCGIKIFLGSSTGDLLLYEEEKLKEIFRETKGMIACHSENEEMLAANIHIRDQAKSAHDHPVWRNVETALSSTKRLISFAKEVGRKVHVLHITTKEEIEFLRENKDHCTVEVTPQHLTLFAPNCYDELGSFAQMNPPIREITHRDALWEGVLNDTVDVIATDHAPHTREEKERKYPLSPSGMPGAQTFVPIMLDWVAKGKISLRKLVQLICESPADLYNMNYKGRIKEGHDADFTIVDLNETFEIKNDEQKNKVGWTPFHGKKVTGRPKMTIVNGQIVMENGNIFEPAGQPIK